MKKILFNFLTIFTFDFIFKLLIKKDLIILLYHDVSNKPSRFHRTNNLNVTKSNFEKQLNFISKYYFFVDPKKITKNLDMPKALITFDDGHKSYFKFAVPILKKKNIPSIHFINFQPVENNYFFAGFSQYLIENNYIKKKKLLDLKVKDIKKYLRDQSILTKAKKYYGKFASKIDLKSQRKNKIVYFGNHLYNHYNASSLDLNELDFYYKKNKKKLSKYKNYIDYFSYPFGQKNLNYNKSTDFYLKNKLGTKKIFYADTLSFNRNKKNFYHRMSMHNDTNLNNFKKKIIYFKLKNFLNSFF